jgi:hypothetical protein
LFQEVSDDELAVLKDDSVAELSDAIRRDEAPAFVRSLCAFLIGAAIRGNDPEHAPQPRDRKYAMVLHTDVAKTKHHAQTELVQLVMKLFLRSIESGDGWFQRIFLTEWTSLSKSYSCAGGIAEQKATHQHVARILRDEEYTIQAVNSDKNVDSLLDSETAELILRETCNIFVGGNILDRGITIPRLISFYYGRNPKVMQADTVLQHSRMYGARTPMDVAVTRFFTTRNVYNRLKMTHQSDTILREDFEREVRTGASNVVLLSKSPKADSDGSRFSFCSVSKIALSNVVTLREDSAITLDNFETRGGRQVERILRKIEGMIRSEWRDSDSSHFIEHDYAADIMSELSSVLHPCKGALVNWDVMNGLLDCCTKTEVNDRRVIKLLAITGRDLNRAASMGKSADSIMSRGLRNRIYGSHRNNPTLVLLQQQGSADQGWNDYPFWWPILISPTKCKSMMYTASLPIA